MRTLQLLTLVFLGPVLCGCYLVRRDDIEVRDGEVFFPSGRLSLELDHLVRGPVPSDDGEARRESVLPTLSVDLEVGHAGGDSLQTLGPTESIRFDGEVVDGPAGLRSDFELCSGHVGARGGLEIAEQLRLEILLTGSAGSLDLLIQEAGTRLHERLLAGGPGIGVRGEWHPREEFNVYVQAMEHFLLLGRQSDTASLGTIDVGVGIRPIEHVRLFGGWRWLNYENEKNSSDIELELSGPVVGVQLEF